MSKAGNKRAIKIGKYISGLRGEKYTQAKLAALVDERLKKTDGDSLCANTVSEWERGNSIPSLEHIKALADIFGKTMAEIWEGEDLNADFYDKYITADSGWWNKYETNELFEIKNSQAVLIRKRIQVLIKKRLSSDLTGKEGKEFEFLFRHFFEVSDYGWEYIDADIEDKYNAFIFAFYKKNREIKDCTENEKYWEVRKLLTEGNDLFFAQQRICDMERSENTVKWFEVLEDWQKDYLLMSFSEQLPLDAEIEKYYCMDLEEYERENGEYDKDRIIKDCIRKIILKGACLNTSFLRHKKKVVKERRIIDRMEELYELCLKPLEIIVAGDNESAVYRIENNAKNRFLVRYYHSLRSAHKRHYSLPKEYDEAEELYKWFNENETVPDSTYEEIAKKIGADTNKKRKYWVDKVKKFSNIDETFAEMKNKEIEVKNGVRELQELLHKLQMGEKIYDEVTYEKVGAEMSLYDYAEEIKNDMNFAEYNAHRDKNKTKDLLKDLDILSFEEIKEKYFNVGSEANEYK